MFILCLHSCFMKLHKLNVSIWTLLVLWTRWNVSTRYFFPWRNVLEKHLLLKDIAGYLSRERPCGLWYYVDVRWLPSFRRKVLPSSSGQVFSFSLDESASYSLTATNTSQSGCSMFLGNSRVHGVSRPLIKPALQSYDTLNQIMSFAESKQNSCLIWYYLILFLYYIDRASLYIQFIQYTEQLLFCVGPLCHH